MKDGKICEEDCKSRILAHFLDGKVYNFYMQHIAADSPDNWNLHKFFTELFNYCFPLNYCQKMRMKLEGLFQGPSQSISEYMYELQELFSMIGTMPDNIKVIKLWYGLRPRIQKVMWKDSLHPDTSTWDEIAAKAEMIELANSVVNP